MASANTLKLPNQFLSMGTSVAVHTPHLSLSTSAVSLQRPFLSMGTSVAVHTPHLSLSTSAVSLQRPFLSMGTSVAVHTPHLSLSTSAVSLQRPFASSAGLYSSTSYPQIMQLFLCRTTTTINIFSAFSKQAQQHLTSPQPPLHPYFQHTLVV
ncbi:hypothetical protein L218DRAFT_1004924 [Marasmius fiardii PR-910]|nr:hypothetical protein L218DRAFT_1004924 [Marasmius fiardii PR-910]